METDLLQQEEETISRRLDSSWIEDFEVNDKLYEKYYLDDLYSLKVISIYLDICMNIVNVKEERFFLKKMNFLSKEELIGLLKKNGCYQTKTYKIQSILKYNLTLQPTEIQPFLQDRDHDPDIDNKYLQPIQHIEDTSLSPSISMFQDLNDIYFLFAEKQPSSSLNATKRVIMSRPMSSKRKKTRKQK